MVLRCFEMVEALVFVFVKSNDEVSFTQFFWWATRCIPPISNYTPILIYTPYHFPNLKLCLTFSLASTFSQTTSHLLSYLMTPISCKPAPITCKTLISDEPHPHPSRLTKPHKPISISILVSSRKTSISQISCTNLPNFISWKFSWTQSLSWDLRRTSIVREDDSRRCDVWKKNWKKRSKTQ